jgi:hypothetical protein
MFLAPRSPLLLLVRGNVTSGFSNAIEYHIPAQYVGTSGLPQGVTVTNNGSTSLAITSVTTSVTDFGTLSACGSTVAAGSSCTIGVFFDPTAGGTRTETLTITDNAGNSPQTVALTGSGQDFL